MERISQKQDDQLLHYLDGTLTEKAKAELEEQLKNDTHLEIRFEELRRVHHILESKAKLEYPSKVFTERVMGNLDQLPARSTLSAKNGILLLCGILVAVGALTLLLSIGVFDNMNSAISLEKMVVKNDFIKNPLPSIPFHARWLINGIVILTLGLAFVLLDRTILRPFFEKRSPMRF
jgi:hypothetical protein